jgi:hypothetical protein
MKKLLLVAILAVAGISAAVAQPRAIGLNIGYGLDVSYQHSIGKSNMIDLSVNIPAFAGIGATATYDWINPFGTQIPWNNKGEWNWSLGAGAGLGIYGFRAPSLYVGAVGHVGVSYDFWFPLQLSVDWRPNVGIVTGPLGGGNGGSYDDGWGMPAKAAAGAGVGFNAAGLYTGITIGVRYLF